ncbi:MAG TPA: hypothetical protein VN699_18760, partial [Pirellulales bacterium]|nr:hypothetical protein [Pirellulales bacterium]
MRTIWRSLLWREWHEHKWKLAALAAIMFSLQLVVIVEDPGMATPQIFVWVLCGAPGAFFLGLHAASGERSGRTLEFVRAFPANMRRFAIAKLAMGAFASVAPVLAALLLAIVWLAIWRATGGAVAYREAMFTEQAAPLTDLLLSGIAAAAFSLSVFLWTAAAGMNQPTELRAAAAGIVMFIGWATLTSVTLVFRAWERHPTIGFHPIAWEYALAAGPAGSLAIIDFDSVPKWQVILLQFVILSAV